MTSWFHIQGHVTSHEPITFLVLMFNICPSIKEDGSEIYLVLSILINNTISSIMHMRSYQHDNIGLYYLLYNDIKYLVSINSSAQTHILQTAIPYYVTYRIVLSLLIPINVTQTLLYKPTMDGDVGYDVSGENLKNCTSLCIFNLPFKLIQWEDPRDYLSFYS